MKNILWLFGWFCVANILPHSPLNNRIYNRLHLLCWIYFGNLIWLCYQLVLKIENVQIEMLSHFWWNFCQFNQHIYELLHNIDIRWVELCGVCGKYRRKYSILIMYYIWGGTTHSNFHLPAVKSNCFTRLQR